MEMEKTKSFTWHDYSFEAENDEGWFTVTCDLECEIEQTFYDDYAYERIDGQNEKIKVQVEDEDYREINSLVVKNCEITEIKRWYVPEHGSLTENAKGIEDYINSQEIADMLECLALDKKELFE